MSAIPRDCVRLILRIQTTRIGRSSRKALEILSELCAGILSADNPHYRSIMYISWLHQIEDQLSSIRQELQHNAALHDLGYQSESVAVKELFVLATLMYMEKKSINSSSERLAKLMNGLKTLF
jgi:hypothetical protein